jgi:transposase
MNRREFFRSCVTPAAVAPVRFGVRNERALEQAGQPMCPRCASYLAVPDHHTDGRHWYELATGEAIAVTCYRDGCGWQGEFVLRRVQQ